MVSRRAPSYDPGRQYDVHVHDVEYRRAGGESWLARVYQPKGDGPFPAVLDVHGGVWNLRDRTRNAPMDQKLAASGLVVVAVDFRLAPQHPYPAQIADVNYATRWLKAHAHEFNADSRSIGGFGLSSGGHTIMLSAMRPRDPRYAALPLNEAPDADATLAYVLLVSSVLDPYARYLFAQETGRDDLVAMTKAYFSTEDSMREGNPQLLLERSEPSALPPILVVQGTADANVPMRIPERFVAAYRQAGGHAELAVFTGMSHGFALQPGPETDRALGLMKAFVTRQLAAASTVVRA